MIFLPEAEILRVESSCTKHFRKSGLKHVLLIVIQAYKNTKNEPCQKNYFLDNLFNFSK